MLVNTQGMNCQHAPTTVDSLPWDCGGPRALDDKFFYMMFLPVSPVHTGSFGILSEIFIVREALNPRNDGAPPRYLVDQAQVDCLLMLQCSLDFINTAIIHHYSLHLHLSLRLLCPSSSLLNALFRQHEVKEYARWLGLLFQYLVYTQLAFTSLLVWMIRTDNGNLDHYPKLVESLQKTGTSPLSATFMEEFLGCWVCDFGVPRVGAFVDCSQGDIGHNYCYSLLERIIEAAPCVPLWLYCSGDTQQAKFYMEQLFPSLYIPEVVFSLAELTQRVLIWAPEMNMSVREHSGATIHWVSTTSPALSATPDLSHPRTFIFEQRPSRAGRAYAHHVSALIEWARKVIDSLLEAFSNLDILDISWQIINGFVNLFPNVMLHMDSGKWSTGSLNVSPVSRNVI